MSDDTANRRFTGSRFTANRFGLPRILGRTENLEPNATDAAKSTEEFWDSVQRSRDVLAPLVTRAALYLARLPEIKRLVQRRDWARDRIGHPRVGKKARLVFDAHNLKVTQFYAEFKAFTKEVLAAFEKLHGVLPEANVEALKRQVDFARVKATCDAIQRAAERVEEFWHSRPVPPVASATTGNARRGKYGPAPAMDRHRKIADAVNRGGGDWRQERTLEKIAAELDGQGVPVPAAWKRWSPAPHSWKRAVEYHEDRVRKAIAYNLKMAAR